MKLNRFGYPKKNVIRFLLNRKGIETSLITFSAGYDEGKRVGILWTRSDIKKEMEGIEEYLIRAGIKIRRMKKGPRVHSMWFDPIEIPEN